MKAVIEIKGKQYIVEQGTILDVDFLNSDEEYVEISNILLIIDKNETSIGTPLIDNYTVKAKVLNKSFKDKKVLVFKFKTKTGYKLTQGHRQQYTRLYIESISKKSAASNSSSLKEVKKKAPATKKESKVSGS